MNAKKELEQLENLMQVVKQLELIGEYEVADVVRYDIKEKIKEVTQSAIKEERLKGLKNENRLLMSESATKRI